MFVYPVNLDDSSGQSCNQGKFPIVSLIKRLTSNYTVSCTPATTPPLITTVAPKNRTKIITPRWKTSRIDHFIPGGGLIRDHRRLHNASCSVTSVHLIVYIYSIFLFLFLVWLNLLKRKENMFPSRFILLITTGIAKVKIITEVNFTQSTLAAHKNINSRGEQIRWIQFQECIFDGLIRRIFHCSNVRNS